MDVTFIYNEIHDSVVVMCLQMDITSTTELSVW